ncbi:MAG: porphobilinogen synthase [Candidatus Omnitrophica bacterium CG11_big_fil_rev_8_21_14_0_20_42_13]|uniref:Delta-aminolevulinic acid dehydratase n=1 Tax=Candidatus Ghiorseimicrobium undicola TaxID=1974746 RepID=A0A2H0LYK4_9BACT|nr:MAG: porphobilinogen synthase [Candidatus Omnitrophica bacterium CG11_big_fil_rev_8_21_14_0_20_42_13]
MTFPKIRMRDRRKDEATRKRFRQTPEVSARDLIMPLFVKEGIGKKKEIKSMPGIYQFSLNDVVAEAKSVYKLGIGAIILFGIPKYKDEIGSFAYDDNGITQEVIRLIKKAVPKLTVIADVCMCEYTSHGHCGVLKRPNTQYSIRNTFTIDNDKTTEILAKIALSYAIAGVDIAAPSAMMDGQVRAIKEALLKNKFPKVKIMSYSSKYASSFYGPFRDAAESPPRFGDRKTYQMDYYNSDEAVIEAKLDIAEGADMVMVKPALGYQDIIYRLKKELKFPLACYNVSGEYAMIKAAAQRGLLDEKKVVLEMLTGFKRAGADKIITYYAKSAAYWLKNHVDLRGLHG